MAKQKIEPVDPIDDLRNIASSVRFPETDDAADIAKDVGDQIDGIIASLKTAKSVIKAEAKTVTNPTHDEDSDTMVGGNLDEFKSFVLNHLGLDAVNG